MKKILLLVCSIAIFATTNAQTNTITDHLNAKKTITLNKVTVTDIQKNGALSDSTKLPTSKAVKEFVEGVGGYSFSGWQPSLLTQYHTAEGVVINIGGDTLLNIFRIDSLNRHVSDSLNDGGALVQRYSYDAGLTWQQYTNTYNSIYDDRNVIGGRLSSGRIVLIFRRYRSTTANDVGRIYSDDNGASWSSYSSITTTLTSPQPFGKIILSGDGKYKVVINEVGKVQIYQSTDGTSWSVQSEITKTNIDETAIAYVGSGKMIAISRDQNYSNPVGFIDSSYFMHRSADNGTTWSYLGRTGMNNNQIGVNWTAPTIEWDSVRANVIAIAYTRHYIAAPSGFQDPTKDSINIYIQSADSAYANTWGKKLSHSRPLPNQRFTYGYPTLAKLNNGNYIGIYTETSSLKTSDSVHYSTVRNERANFYQFDINYINLNNSTAANRYSLSTIFNTVTGVFDYKSLLKSFNTSEADSFNFASNGKGLLLASPNDNTADIIQIVSKGRDSIYNRFLQYGSVHLAKPNGSKVGVGTDLPVYKADVVLTDANNNTVSSVLGITHNSSGTSANGIGTAIDFLTKNSSYSISPVMAQITSITTDEASLTGDLAFSTRTNNNLTEYLRIKGSSGKILVGTATDYAHAGAYQHKLIVNYSDATTNTIINGLAVGRKTTGTAAVGIGAGIAFVTDNVYGATSEIGSVAAVQTNIWDIGSDLVFYNRLNNVLGEKMRITSGGNLIIGATTGSSSATLEATSTTKGFLPPRMTGAQAEAISSPAEGLLIYSTNGSGTTITSKGWWGYEGSTWVKLN